MRKAKHEKEKAALPGLRQEIAKLIEEVKPKTEKMGHPFYHFAKQGKTLHDYFEFVARQLSFSKAKKLIRELKNVK
jgi:hypothetical protein